MNFRFIKYFGFLFFLFIHLSSYGQPITVAGSTSEVGMNMNTFQIDSLPHIQSRLGKYFIGKRKLPTREVFDRLSCVDSTAFNQFYKGKQVQKIGGALALGGAGVVIIGELVLIAEIIGDPLYSDPNSNNTGIGILVVGGGVSLSGLTAFIVGKIKKNNAVKLYNQRTHSKKLSYSWYVNPSFNKLSVGLKF